MNLAALLTPAAASTRRAFPDPKFGVPDQNSAMDPKSKTLGVPWDSKQLDRFCPKSRTGSLMYVA